MRNYYLILVLLFVMLPSCKSTTIYVDKNNTAGPWDGTEKHPFKTIKEGINATQLGYKETVEVFSGVYNENVVMKPGITLRRALNAQQNTMIIGSQGSPTILAKDHCAVAGFIIDGGTTGVLVDLNTTASPQKDQWTSVANCHILSYDAIYIKTPSTLSFGNGVRRTVRINLSDNWIDHNTQGYNGTGMRAELNGPKTGELSMYLQIRGNVIKQKFTGIYLEAKGQGPNPGGLVRAQFTGYVENNLIVSGHTGIHLKSINLGSTEPTLFNNTIANNAADAIVASVESGADGDSSTHPDVVNNILSGNKGYGYKEFGKKTSAKSLNHNLFYQNNMGHYFDEQTLQDINTQTGLNTPIVNKQVVFISGSGNLVAKPQFVQGNFTWNGDNLGQMPEGAYFLTQSGADKSPAIDSGLGSAQDAQLNLLSTSTNFSWDTGKVDIGFHYTKPWKP